MKAFCDDVPAAELVDRPFTMEAEFAPGARSAVHIHPNQEERYDVTYGVLDLFLDGQWRRVTRGESVRIPKGTIHAFRNSSRAPARATNEHDPGLRTQEYLEVLARLIREGKLTGMSGLRNGIYLSLHSMEFRREFVSVRPPDWFVRAVAALGRTLGYRLS